MPPTARTTDTRTTDSTVEAGLEAGVDDGGSVEGGSDDGGAEEGGADDGGAEDGGAEDGGADEGGAEEGGADDGGADEGGAEDDGGADEGGADDGADEDLVGWPDPEPPGWIDTELIGVGARVVPVNAAGLMNELGDSEAGAEGDAPGAAGRVPGAVAVAFAVLPAAACGWTLLAGGVRPAPIRATAATADPATRAPVRPAEASGREMRCRP